MTIEALCKQSFLGVRVFSSAGAGRTGTFCALSTVLERVKAEGILDVFQTVKSLRLQRPHMVQTLVSSHIQRLSQGHCFAYFILLPLMLCPGNNV